MQASSGSTSILKVVVAGAAAMTLSIGAASAQTPDVIVYDIGVDHSDTDDIVYYGQADGIAAYSFATQSCNSGTGELDWYSSSGSTAHPVIGQNMYRYANGRFEQIGQSWLKHGFCAVNEFENQCGPCQTTSCDTLGVGCADTYWATLNDGRSGGSKTMINATTGGHVHGGPSPTGNNATRGRLQVALSDINPALNPGAEYFIEGQYVTFDDADAGADRNNTSYRRLTVNSISNIDGGGPTIRERPAITAWRDVDSDVTLRSVLNAEDTDKSKLYFLAYKVTQRGPSRWDYEYALQNVTSDQSAMSFSLTAAPESSATNISFHDVDYHSGDPYDGTDWPGAKNGGEISWSTDVFSTNPNANALRWGTMYNFRFTSNYGPDDGQLTIGLFKSDINTEMVVNDVPVPMIPPVARSKAPLPEVNPPLAGGSVQLPVVVNRNGSRFNPDTLSSGGPAVVGQSWRASVDLGGSSQSILFISLAGPTKSTFTRMGELLIQAPYSGHPGVGEHTIAIPGDPALQGRTFSAQAAVRTAKGWKLTNALDVPIVIGLD